MKKVLAIVLMLAMVLSVVGCQANNSGKTEAKGSVYYLNFKPEADAAWHYDKLHRLTFLHKRANIAAKRE